MSAKPNKRNCRTSCNANHRESYLRIVQAYPLMQIIGSSFATFLESPASSEALTLIQTRKIDQFPIVLFGKKYWQRLVELLEEMVTSKTIDPSDMKLLLITDSVEEAMRHVQRHAVEQFGLRRRKVTMRRSWLLRE